MGPFVGARSSLPHVDISFPDFPCPIPLPSDGGKSGEKLIGDLGILRGNGIQTVQRVYWNNLDTALVSDIPSEARLAPAN